MDINFYGNYDRLVRLACPEYDYCLELIVENIAESAESILDLGSGTGNLIAAILKKHPRIKVYGLELQQALVETSNKKLKRPNVFISQGNILDFNWPRAEGIISSLAVHHFTDEQKESTFRTVFNSSRFFLYFDLFRGETGKQERQYKQYIFTHMREKGLSEEMVLAARKSMEEHDKPLTLKRQNRMFRRIGFDYRLLYFNQGFGVYLCTRKS
jgi:ubiquinone/menaquinone biosynthesis C-methylase UbiE